MCGEIGLINGNNVCFRMGVSEVGEGWSGGSKLNGRVDDVFVFVINYVVRMDSCFLIVCDDNIIV